LSFLEFIFMSMSSGSIQLVVGLGNPGLEYANTRHNAGFWFVDALLASFGGAWGFESKFHGFYASVNVQGAKLHLLKPSTFMNRSGMSVQALAQFYRIPQESILVVHDELDLPAGVMRLKWSGGHAGHNGLKDIARALGSLSVWRLRIGVDHPGDRHLVSGYVLSAPSVSDRLEIDRGMLEIIQHWAMIQQGKFDAAMQILHKK
jgi:peptidyl-tRNA hydrolase, PTH1 family